MLTRHKRVLIQLVPNFLAPNLGSILSYVNVYFALETLLFHFKESYVDMLLVYDSLSSGVKLLVPAFKNRILISFLY